MIRSIGPNVILLLGLAPRFDVDHELDYCNRASELIDDRGPLRVTLSNPFRCFDLR